MKENVLRLAALFGLVLFGSACGVFRSAGSPESSPEPVAEVDTATVVPVGRMDERFLAADYAGALAAYDADPALRADPEATFRAGVAAAIPGHRAHDRTRARRLLQQLVADHPATSHRPAAELLLRMLAEETDLRRTIARLDRELEQLKAIDLGVEPTPGEDP